MSLQGNIRQSVKWSGVKQLNFKQSHDSCFVGGSALCPKSTQFCV